MLSLIRQGCEYVFPERVDHKLVRLASSDDVLRLLTPTKINDVTYLFNFREPLVRALVHEAKFHGNQKAWRLLATGLESYLEPLNTKAILLPIPLSWLRRLKRGYNQVTEVAKRAAEGNLHIDVDTTKLHRRRHTTSQTKLMRRDRLSNVEDAFYYQSNDTETPIIILDDVATTGATLKAAREAVLKVHKGPIALLALTH